MSQKERNALLHILMTDYSVDSRVRNETTTLVQEDNEVDVYCLNSREYKSNEEREGTKLVRFGMFENKSLLFLTAYFSMFFASMKVKYQSVHAHDLTALPIAFFISVVKGIPLIYDAHELWSHAMHRKRSRHIINIAIWVEKVLAKRADFIITVSDSIAEFMKHYFLNNNIHVIRNVPSYVHQGDYDLFREEHGIPTDHKIILYQGLISKGRGVSYLFDAARILATNKSNEFTFVFLGSGPYVEAMKDNIQQENLSDKIKILPPVKQDQLLKYTASADIGVHAISNSCLNHDYCLPNKLFEYVSAGLPVVVTNLTELTNFVNTHKIGTTFKDQDATDLADKLAYLIENTATLDEYSTNSKKLRTDLTWENEAKILLKIYEAVLE